MCIEHHAGPGIELEAGEAGEMAQVGHMEDVVPEVQRGQTGEAGEKRLDHGYFGRPPREHGEVPDGGVHQVREIIQRGFVALKGQ